MLLIFSAFLPWYKWDVDSTPLSQKLGNLDPEIVAKYARGSRSSEDILANYGGINPDSLHESANLWQVGMSEGGLFITAIVLLVAIGAAALSLSYGKPGFTGWHGLQAPLATLLGLTAAADLAFIWSRLAALGPLWWEHNQAADATEAAWRQDALNAGFFRLVDHAGVGRWVALLAYLIITAGTVSSLWQRLRAKRTRNTTATGLPAP